MPTTGAHTAANTHPFEQDGRLFVHKGTFGDLDKIDSRLTELNGTDLVLGQTGSERIFALITTETRRHNGDFMRGYPVWIAENLPVCSLNLIITTPTDMWALRYPATHELNVLERDPGGRTHGRSLQADSHRIHGHSPALATARSVIIASEPMDNDRGWRIIEPGELLHIDVNLTPQRSRPLPSAPAHPVTLADPDPPPPRSPRRCPMAQTARVPAPHRCEHQEAKPATMTTLTHRGRQDGLKLQHQYMSVP